MRIIVGIDPGLANTGIVALDERERVVLATTIHSAGEGQPEFSGVMERGMAVASGVVEALQPLENVERVAIEGYEDFGPHLRGARNRWTTPAVAALIGSKVASAGYTVEWQSPSAVMRAYSAHKRMWEQKRTVIEGDDALTNDHLRSAAAHALWASGLRDVVTLL